MWKQMILCTKRSIPIQITITSLKVDAMYMYVTIRPVIIYESETWAITKKHYLM